MFWFIRTASMRTWGVGPFVVIGIENPTSLTAAIAAPVPDAGAASESFPVNAILDESGQHAYFLYYFQSPIGGRPSYVYPYRDVATGGLTRVAPFLYYQTGGGPTLSGFVTDVTRRYIVAATVFPARIVVFQRDPATGQLAQVPGSPFTPTLGTSPIGVTFDPSGRFAYIPDGPSNSVSAYSFDSTNGRLDYIGSYPVGSSPATLARIVGLQ